jgi:hypothetical protein
MPTTMPSELPCKVSSMNSGLPLDRSTIFLSGFAPKRLIPTPPRRQTVTGGMLGGSSLAATQPYAGAMLLIVIPVTRASASCKAADMLAPMSEVTWPKILIFVFNVLFLRDWLHSLRKLLKHIACLRSRNDIVGIDRQQ